MSKGVDGLTDDYFRQRWNAVAAPAAGATCAASSGIANIGARERILVEMIGFSARNATAAGVTMTLTARAASIAGTALASWDFVLPTAVGIQDCYSQVNIVGARGQDVFIEFGTPVASVTQKVSATGWLESST